MEKKAIKIWRKFCVLVVVTCMLIETSVNMEASAVSRLRITGATAPTELKQGSGYVPEGIISSNYNICEVNACILKEEGTAIYNSTALPNTKVFDIANFANKLQFQTLTKGSYVYRIQASDISGMERVFLAEKFEVVSNVKEWVEDCKSLLNYYAKRGFTYGAAQPTYVATRTKNRRANCASYVSWCLQKNGFVRKESDTNQVAQGVAAYVCQLGWKINTDVNQIKAGDVVYYSQKNVTASSQKASIKWIKTHKPNQAGTGKHVDICYNPMKNTFLSAGSSKSINKGTVTTHGSNYMKKHFICSFHYSK